MTPEHKIYADGSQDWHINGKLHRLDGPAYIHTDGGQEWYANGLCHRLDGPACILADGTQAWYINGQRHRTDGPACIYAEGNQEWYINDLDITDQVRAWQQQQGISWPWDQATQAQFALTFL